MSNLMRRCKCIVCRIMDRYFSKVETDEHSFSVPLINIWFWIPRRISKKNRENVKEFHLLNPYFGFMFIVREGEAVSWKWWKYIKRIS